MTRFETLLLMDILMPIVLAVSIYYLQKSIDRRLKKQEKTMEKRASLRKESDEINGDMAEAAMELAYATSVAVENGKTNGEMKKARKMYKDAKEKREAFLKKVGKEAIYNEVKG